jgi:hypothetical protein
MPFLFFFFFKKKTSLQQDKKDADLMIKRAERKLQSKSFDYSLFGWWIKQDTSKNPTTNNTNGNY